MSRNSRLVRCSVAFLPLLCCQVILSAPPKATVVTAKTKITVLYDAFGEPSAMQKDWGYAALVEYGGKHILFDTGNNSDVLAHNAQARGNLEKAQGIRRGINRREDQGAWGTGAGGRSRKCAQSYTRPTLRSSRNGSG